jgi:AcrR family transcriptional regulator
LINDGIIRNHTALHLQFEADVAMGGCIGGKDNQTRNHILDIAEQLICSGGPESVTMNGVARTARISPSTLKLYFSCPDSLCTAVAARIICSLNRAVARHTFGLRGFRKVRATCIATAIYRRDNPGKTAVLEKLGSIKVPDARDENLRELYRLVEENQQALAAAIEEIGGGKASVVGIDPLATGQFLQMALQDAYCMTPASTRLPGKNGACREDFLKNARDPLYRSILISPDN